MAISSGPLVEINIDRIAPGESAAIWPWRVIQSTNKSMQQGDAVKYYMPQFISFQLMLLFEKFSRLADEYTMPSYAHGENRSSSPRTASGLSMIMQGQARMDKELAKSIDLGLIEPSVIRQFNYNEDFEEQDIRYIGALSIVARGSETLMIKELQAVRRNEFLQNPLVPQVVPKEGLMYTVKEIAKALDLDADRLFPENGAMLALPGPQGAPAPTPTNLAMSNMVLRTTGSKPIMRMSGGLRKRM